MVRVYFPNMSMRLVSVQYMKRPPEAVLHVPPRMTKHEIKEYLTKIYNVPVLNVCTSNFLGEYVLNIIELYRKPFVCI